jgi:protein-disulfide isomerase
MALTLAGILACAPTLSAQSAVDVQQLRKEIEALKQRRHAADVRRDMTMAAAVGVRATPTFFVATIDPKTRALKVKVCGREDSTPLGRAQRRPSG